MIDPMLVTYEENLRWWNSFPLQDTALSFALHEFATINWFVFCFSEALKFYSLKCWWTFRFKRHMTREVRTMIQKIYYEQKYEFARKTINNGK